MHMDPIMPYLVGSMLIVLVVALVLRALHQPFVIGYLLVGILLGPHGIGFVEDETILGRLGAIGVVLLLFFIGMESSPRRLIKKWKLAFFGTVAQILISIACVWPLGIWMAWPPGRIIMIGFVISLSSTAVVLNLLRDWDEIDSRVGQNVLVILLAQDLAVIPMMIVISLLGDSPGDHGNPLLQLAGAVFVAATIVFISRKPSIHLPLGRFIRNDHEMQVFTALLICLGLSLLTASLGLSTALGAFTAGMLVGTARETRWVRISLEPFRVVFVAIFFVSIGMLIDTGFIREHWLQILILLLLALGTNTLINALILRFLGDSWRNSIYASALLSQIGEFSFVLIAVGFQTHIISDFGYQLAIAVIALSLLTSPSWIALIKRVSGVNVKPRHARTVDRTKAKG